MQTKPITIIRHDGIKLAGELFIPDAPKATVLFCPGTAAKRGVYKKLLSHLAEQGFLCCIIDYHGFGESRPTSLKHSDITYSDFGTKDLPAAKHWLDNEYPNLPLFVAAHSAGGQQIGFMDNWQGINGMVTFGVSAAHLRAMPFSYRLVSTLFFYGVVPISNIVAGYVAAKRLNLMEDLPKKVAKEWRDWCSVPDYFFDPKYYGKTVPKGGYQDFDFPIVNYHTTDEEISTPMNIDNFWKHIKSSAGITFNRVDPASAGLKALGHFGYFKSALKDSLWTDVVKQLDDMLVGNKS